MLRYLLVHCSSFWTRTDFKALLCILSSWYSGWIFAIPILFQAKVAHNWFFAMNPANRMDIIFKITREMEVKLCMKEMKDILYKSLCLPPYSLCFFHCLINEETQDDENEPSTGLLEAALTHI